MRTDLRITIDRAAMVEIAIESVREARECHHTALQLRRHGHIRAAAWEEGLSRQYLRDARLAMACC